MPWKDKSKYKSEDYQEYMRNYQRSWYQKNKTQRIASALKRKEQLRAFYNQLKEGLECSICGENHPASLQFHHRDPQEKDFNISEAVHEGYSAERIKKEIAKCSVLCANCHAKLHYEWAGKNNKLSQEGLVGQFLEIEEVLSVSPEEEVTHTGENQYPLPTIETDALDRLMT